MGTRRFVESGTVRRPLSDGDWIEVKRELSVSEERRVVLGGTQKMQPGDGGVPGYVVDMASLIGAKVKAYLTDWSFRDAQDKPVRVTPEAIDALTPAAFAEISQALDAYLDERDAEKNAPSGATPLAATSPSVA